MVSKERAKALVKKLSVELFDYCLEFSFHYLRLRLPVTVLFFVTILFHEVRPKVLCIHPKLIIVCRRLRGLMVLDETKQSLTLEKSDGWAALFFCTPITVVIVLLQLLTIWTR